MLFPELIVPPPIEVPPPRDEAELLLRARALAGHTFGSVAERFRVPTADLKRAKGWIGQLLETALGATAANKAAPDFEALGVEMKSIPVDPTGKPKETTFVCSAALDEMGGQSWQESRVRKKLTRVLWIPIQAEDPSIEPLERRFGMPLLWTPDEEQERALQADWDEFAELVAAGMVESITAHRGRCLQMRPKGANARQSRWGVDAHGDPIRIAPRAFYLRASFVQSVLQKGYAIAR